MTRPDEQMLDEVVEQLDESLFSEYVKAKANIVNAIIRKGILESGMDWYETPRPTGKSFKLQECCRSTKSVVFHRAARLRVPGLTCPSSGSRSSEQCDEASAGAGYE